MCKKVLVTGGTGSLGRCLVERFYNNGYNVMFQYNENEDMAKELTQKFPSVESVKINFEYPFEPTVFGDFDILVNNAAYCNPEMLTEDVSGDVWNKVVSVNLTAPFLLTKYVLPQMAEKNWGRIINISSIYGIRPIDTLVPYSTTKAGLIGMTKGIAKEYASHGITCNVVCPGTMDSDLMRKLGIAYCNETGEDIEKYIEDLCEEIPIKRLAKTDDVANIVLFLASDKAEYITGESITVDGGTII